MVDVDHGGLVWISFDRFENVYIQKDFIANHGFPTHVRNGPRDVSCHHDMGAILQFSSMQERNKFEGLSYHGCLVNRSRDLGFSSSKGTFRIICQSQLPYTMVFSALTVLIVSFDTRTVHEQFRQLLRRLVHQSSTLDAGNIVSISLVRDTSNPHPHVRGIEWFGILQQFDSLGRGSPNVQVFQTQCVSDHFVHDLTDCFRRGVVEGNPALRLILGNFLRVRIQHPTLHKFLVTGPPQRVTQVGKITRPYVTHNTFSSFRP
mmetsp:Transcript_13116/g.23775  ORF Transcript_13116/g.23775 Transcript_13116/m.23775 type:complete len:261 (-) Transcript_13116:179-961(-)